MKKLFTLLITITIFTTSYALVKEYHNTVQPFIDAFKANDKDYVAEVIERGGITAKTDFIKRFDEYFDESLSKKIASSTLDDWSMMGWRGIMFGNGLIWMEEDGSIRSINYETDKAKQLRLKAIQKDKDSLHPTMQSFVHNTHQWQTSTSSIRIDKLPNERYRFSSWSSHDLLTLPNMVINNGTFRCDGSACTRIYTFTSGNLKLVVLTGGITSESSPEVSMDTYINGELILEQYMCSTQRCMDRAKDESNNKLVFEGFRQWKK